MAIVGPSGFDGTMSESAAALWTPLLGRMSGVVAGPGDLKPTIVAGDRSVQFAVGTAMQHAIRAPNTTPWTAQMGTISSGIRSDTFVIRRDWTANTATLMIVPGGTTQAVSVAIKTDTPGTGQTDQPLAIAQVTAGQQQPTALIDLREIASDGLRRFASREARDYWLPVPTLGETVIIEGLGRSSWDGTRWCDEWWTSFVPRLWRGMNGTPSVTTYSSPFGRWRRTWDGMVEAEGKVTADWNVSDEIGMELPVAAANRDMTPIGSMWIIGANAPTDQIGAAHIPSQLNIVVPIRRTRGYIALPGTGSDIVYRVRYRAA